MRLTKLKRKTKKALAASARGNYDQKRKGNKANTCVGNFLQSPCFIFYVVVVLEAVITLGLGGYITKFVVLLVKTLKVTQN